MPPKAIFKGQTFAISGKLSQPRKEYEELIRKYGGEVANSVTAAVTFLISNEEDVKACSQKVATAKGRSVPIVQEGFIGSCATAKRLLEPGFFAVKGAASKKRKAAAKEAPKAAAEVAAKKKPRLEASSAAAAAAGPVTTTEAIAVIAKSGLVGKAAVVQEEVSKGFVKGSLTWDVEMVLNDPSKGTDKYYIMQLLAAKAGGGEFWAVQHWGRTGLDGTVHVDGPFPDVILAKQIFRKKYRHKTGNVWGQIGTSFKEVAGKYKLIAKGSMSNTRGRWQYYLHNEVDGKTIGWYDYEAPAAKNMEKYWRQFESNDGLDIRLIQSDYFKYEVNFGEMIQKNTTSGMRRAIRRVAAGEEASTAPPAAIPEPALPVAAAAASDSGSSDEEVEEDEEEDEDEEDEEEDDEAPRRAQNSVRDELQEGVMRRLAEQMMLLNLKQLAQKQKCRYGGRYPGTGSIVAESVQPASSGSPKSSSSPSAEVRSRQEVIALATSFTSVYARTQGILEESMTLQPPRRGRHSVVVADLLAYSSSTTSPAISPSARSRATTEPIGHSWEPL
mmetsp:Transcript_58822/g.129242  ORF Transcript_58822/g.129242 Transcript_58822/m.129242 type:complete len:556 (+) Transcript_58822:111-1778(+)